MKARRKGSKIVKVEVALEMSVLQMYIEIRSMHISCLSANSYQGSSSRVKDLRGGESD